MGRRGIEGRRRAGGKYERGDDIEATLKVSGEDSDDGDVEGDDGTTRTDRGRQISQNASNSS